MNNNAKVLIEKATGNQTGWFNEAVDVVAYCEIWHGKNWADRFEIREEVKVSNEMTVAVASDLAGAKCVRIIKNVFEVEGTEIRFVVDETDFVHVEAVQQDRIHLLELQEYVRNALVEMGE